MSQTPGEQPAQPATARAEVLLANLGRRLDLFAAQAGRRVQNVAASIREEADRMDQPHTASGEKAHASMAASAEERGKIAMEKAEEVVDRLGQRLGGYLAMAGFQMQRATARLREEGEDIWAEAQHIRQERSRTSH